MTLTARRNQTGKITSGSVQLTGAIRQLRVRLFDANLSLIYRPPQQTRPAEVGFFVGDRKHRRAMEPNERFRFTEGLDYELRFSNYYGDGNQIAEGSYDEMRERAAKRIKYARKQHAITSLNRGWQWEIEDDGKSLVDPRCGVLEIRCTTPVYDESDWLTTVINGVAITY